MIELTGIELSQRVAELYGIEEWSFFTDEGEYGGGHVMPLHEDSAWCFELMVEHEILGSATTSEMFSDFLLVQDTDSHVDYYAFNDLQKNRTAILQCLVKMKEGE